MASSAALTSVHARGNAQAFTGRKQQAAAGRGQLQVGMRPPLPSPWRPAAAQGVHASEDATLDAARPRIALKPPGGRRAPAAAT